MIQIVATTRNARSGAKYISLAFSQCPNLDGFTTCILLRLCFGFSLHLHRVLFLPYCSANDYSVLLVISFDFFKLWSKKVGEISELN